jgi:quinol monooxygenase YgiN
MIIVSGKLQIKANLRDEFISRSKQAIRSARSDAGCIDFSVSPDPLDENRVNVFEEWKSKAELESFRGNGPEDDLFELIENAEVIEREI